MATKTIVKDNEVAYSDKLLIQPMSLSELSEAQVVDPPLTEEVEVETCACGTGSDQDPITPGGGGGLFHKFVDLHADIRPTWPTPEYKKFPENYTIYLPKDMLHPPV